MAITLLGSHRIHAPSVRFVALLILLLFVISSIIIFNSSFSDQSPPWVPESDKLIKKLEQIDDYDAGCSGYSMGRVLREQKRILASVRAELSESQVKIEEIRQVQEELQRLIPQKQLELSALEGEIEAAQRELEELRETQNVRVFLPFSPVQTSETRWKTDDSVQNTAHFDDVIDYTKCSISSFMPVFVDVASEGKTENEWRKVFEDVVQNRVSNSEDACLTLTITNGLLNSEEKIPPNTVIFNIGDPISKPDARAVIVQSSKLRSFDIALDMRSVGDLTEVRPLLPLHRNNLISVILPKEMHLNLTSLESSEAVVIRRCAKEACGSSESKLLLESSTFCFLFPSDDFIHDFFVSLRVGCIPIVFSNSQILPLEGFLDWRRASYRVPLERLPEAHFIVRSFESADILEMRRVGRSFYQHYFSDRRSIAVSLLSALRHRLQMPTKETRGVRAEPLFNSSFTSPKGSVVNVQPNFDDEYLLGPLESRVESTSFAHNFSEFQLYSYDTWNIQMSPFRSKQFLINAAEPPAESEFHEDTRIGFRPIEPGSGVEFSKALGGNRQREQFTVVLLTYERDVVLAGALERLHQLPYLNKVLVVWNNVHREPPDTWPSLHVPVEFVRVAENSLNNRFVPWDRIETEAVLSLDDDIDLMQQEIVLAFRVWRENRERIVGFPARYHARYGDSMFYNSNHTCQMSMILTGAAFIHKNYLSIYTHQMPRSIREHVDRVRNCEDIAMNYLVAHLTRRPPIKTTSRWTLKCPTCTESLFKEDSHFEKRHECMRFFTEVFGYNPLKFSQFRADSILFKTRLPANHQKCFKYV